jgi:hypothetical protein
MNIISILIKSFIWREKHVCSTITKLVQPSAEERELELNK